MKAGHRGAIRFVSCGLIAVIAAALQGDEPPAKLSDSGLQAASQTVTLKYNFQSGQFANYSVSDQVRYITKQGENSFETVQKNDSSKHFRVVSVDEDGSALLEPVIDRIRMSAKIHDRPEVEFDSDREEVAPPEFEKHKATIGKPMARFRISPDGELLSVQLISTDVSKALTAAAAKADPKMNFLIPLPKEAVAVGYRWKQKYDEPVSLGQGLTQQIPMLRQFELAGVENGIATIKYRTSILTALNDPKIQGQLIQQTPSGVIEFDIARGLIRSRRSITNESVVNALGPKTVLQVFSESTEKLMTGENGIQQVGFQKETSESQK